MNINDIKTGVINIPGVLHSTGGDGDGQIGNVVAYAGDIYDYSVGANQASINQSTTTQVDTLTTRANNLQNTVANIQAYNIGSNPTAGVIGIATGTGLLATDVQQAIAELAERTESLPNFEGYLQNLAENTGIINYNSSLIEQKVNAIIACLQQLMTIIVFHSGTPYQLSQQVISQLQLLRATSIDIEHSNVSVCGRAVCGCAVCGTSTEQNQEQQYTGSTCGKAVCARAIVGKI